MIVTAAQFKDARKLLGWTKVRLAAKAGVKWTTIAYLEGGVRPVPTQTLISVHCALEAAGVQFVSGQPRAIWKSARPAPGRRCPASSRIARAAVTKFTNGGESGVKLRKLK
jgi:DNA-binding XRE family transcriptional regulator